MKKIILCSSLLMLCCLPIQYGLAIDRSVANSAQYIPFQDVSNSLLETVVEPEVCTAVEEKITLPITNIPEYQNQADTSEQVISNNQILQDSQETNEYTDGPAKPAEPPASEKDCERPLQPMYTSEMDAKITQQNCTKWKLLSGAVTALLDEDEKKALAKLLGENGINDDTGIDMDLLCEWLKLIGEVKDTKSCIDFIAKATGKAADNFYMVNPALIKLDCSLDPTAVAQARVDKFLGGNEPTLNNQPRGGGKCYFPPKSDIGHKFTVDFTIKNKKFCGCGLPVCRAPRCVIDCRK